MLETPPVINPAAKKAALLDGTGRLRSKQISGVVVTQRLVYIQIQKVSIKT
jgi:hypothetical protein